MDDSAWIAAVDRLVRTHFSETSRAFLLAKVAPALHKEGIQLNDVLMGRRLKAVLETDAADRVRIVQHPLQPLAWGIVPAETVLPADLANLFPPPKPTSASPRSPSFEPGFWSAFVKPLEAGHRRILRAEMKPVTFDDVPAGSIVADTALEIEFNDLISSELSGTAKAEAVREKASQWCIRKGLSLDAFYANSAHRTTSAASEAPDWILRLGNLDDRDLARISIPLDIVKRLV